MAALLSTTAQAADLPIPYVPYEFTGWYLRGDIGMTNQRVKSLYNVLYNTAASVDTVQKDFDSAPLFGVGIGYQYNSWLRFDATGEYRGKADFHGLDIVQVGKGYTITDEYRASKSEWLVLANVYADLGTWYSLTPFVGVGIGTSYNTISNFLDVNTVTQGVAYASSASKWNFAWALHAGISYRVTPALSFEFAYRYVNLGDGLSGDLVTYQGVNKVYNPMEFNTITSHDLKFGVRWLLTPPMPMEALAARG
jgi:opacity protein-like surface antigen